MHQHGDGRAADTGDDSPVGQHRRRPQKHLAHLLRKQEDPS